MPAPQQLAVVHSKPPALPQHFFPEPHCVSFAQFWQKLLTSASPVQQSAALVP
jgi:hypothetical protein